MQVEISEDGFINLLLNQNSGALVEELDRELTKGIGAILDHGGDSKITLTIGVKRIAGLEAAVNILHDVKVAHPKEPRPKKAMFITNGNGVTDQPQKQERLALGETTAQRAPTLTPTVN